MTLSVSMSCSPKSLQADRISASVNMGTGSLSPQPQLGRSPFNGTPQPPMAPSGVVRRYDQHSAAAPAQEFRKESGARCGDQPRERPEHGPTNRGARIRCVDRLGGKPGSSGPGGTPATAHVVPGRLDDVLPLRHVIRPGSCLRMGHERLPHLVLGPELGRQRPLPGAAAERCVGRTQSASRKGGFVRLLLVGSGH